MILDHDFWYSIPDPKPHVGMIRVKCKHPILLFYSLLG